jgi:peptidoglycan DL-endopeptidase LytF
LEGRNVLKPATATGRLIAALAVVLVVAPMVPTIGRAADIAPGGGGVIAADAPVLVRTAPGYDAPTAGEAAPGTWVTVVGGPEYDAEGNAWYPTDAGGYVPAWAVGEGAVAAQEVAAEAAAYEEVAPADAGYDAAAEPVYEEPVYEEAVYAEPVYEEPVYEDPAAQPVYDETVAQDPAAQPVAAEPLTEPAYEEPAAAPAPEAPAYDPNNVVATAWIAGTNGDGAVCRAGMGFDTAEVGWLAEGEAVPVIGDTVGEWQPVACGGAAAFIHASFVAWQQPTTVQSNAAGTDGVGAEADAAPLAASEEQNGRRDKDDRNRGDGGAVIPPANGGASGQQIADFAMQFEGYPYVYAGEGPHAFDCSGFTMYVIRETLGLDITHDMFVQYDMGQKVDRNELQPGDLVFFQNTFRPGMSHNGIYIGGGKMIHAENENTGVKVSDIDSEYYASRWYGAVRFP